MKNIVGSFSIVFILTLAACSKKDNSHPGHPGGDSTGTPPPTGGSTCNAQPSDVAGISIFPTDNPWQQDITKAPLDSYDSVIRATYMNTGLHAGFGSGLHEGKIMGIPFTAVCGSQQKIPVTFRGNAYDDNYGNESDPGPYPIPLNATIEPGDGRYTIYPRQITYGGGAYLTRET